MRVLIVSNHMLIGQSLATMLQSLPVHEPLEVRVRGAAAAAETAKTWKADILVIEAIGNFAAATAMVRTVLDADADARILILGTGSDDASVCAAISVGASGYLPQEASPATLAATLQGMMRGELGLSRRDALSVVRHLRRTGRTHAEPLPIDLDTHLTQREREVFELVRRGKRSREIAEDLSIADSTVYKHIQNILDKLHVHNRAQAVYLADLRSDLRLDPR
ncbi:MAG: response regulator transcription factor [Ktedonobacterales bacterium]